jgi:predicted nucleic acid-binding protein
VPAAVWEEITRTPAFSPAASLEAAGDARATGWLQVTTAGNRPLVMQLETVLDAGEAEAIALAVERAPSLLLIDERDGRHMARTLGVPLTGYVGRLVTRQSPRACTRNQTASDRAGATTSFSPASRSRPTSARGGRRGILRNRLASWSSVRHQRYGISSWELRPQRAQETHRIDRMHQEPLVLIQSALETHHAIASIAYRSPNHTTAG